MMNLLDFSIIYLACGSPFGVYYFLTQNTPSKKLLVKAILVTIFWIPFGISLLHKLVTSRSKTENLFISTENQVNLTKIQKAFENLIPSDSNQISLFEFREVFERYVGLSLSRITHSQSPGESEKGIFEITDNKNVEISAICLNRRNRRKLFLHQIKARDDFFTLLKDFADLQNIKSL